MKDEKIDLKHLKADAIQRLKDGKGGAEGAFTPLIKNLLS